jgi:hypothetical protein
VSGDLANFVPTFTRPKRIKTGGSRELLHVMFCPPSRPEIVHLRYALIKLPRGETLPGAAYLTKFCGRVRAGTNIVGSFGYDQKRLPSRPWGKRARRKTSAFEDEDDEYEDD